MPDFETMLPHLVAVQETATSLMSSDEIKADENVVIMRPS